MKWHTAVVHNKLFASILLSFNAVYAEVHQRYMFKVRRYQGLMEIIKKSCKCVGNKNCVGEKSLDIQDHNFLYFTL